MDHLSRIGRSRNMAAIRSKNTKPELMLRSELTKLGATGYRIHRKDLPGCPDLAYIRWRVAVFVDGVFWHGHPEHWNPEKAASEYWKLKIERNIQRDNATNAALAQSGWQVVRVWDTDVRNNMDECTSKVLLALNFAGRPNLHE